MELQWYHGVKYLLTLGCGLQIFVVWAESRGSVMVFLGHSEGLAEVPSSDILLGNVHLC